LGAPGATTTPVTLTDPDGNPLSVDELKMTDASPGHEQPSAQRCAQTADHRYVSVEGPVASIQDSVTVDERRALAGRYLGVADADRYIEATAAESEKMSQFWMRPERWLATDQTSN
jgi:hypothetical protein